MKMEQRAYKPTISPRTGIPKSPSNSGTHRVYPSRTSISSNCRAKENDPLVTETEDLSASKSTYKEIWIRMLLSSTSGMMFTVVMAVLYSLYVLCYPYGNSISFGLLLSVVLHPRSLEEYPLFRSICIKRMQETQQMWAESSTVSGIFGSVLSLRHFVSYALMQLILFFGLNKINPSFLLNHFGYKEMDQQGNKEVYLTQYKGGRLFLRILVFCIISTVAHVMIGISSFLGLHVILFSIFAHAVIFMSAENFVVTMWRVWQFALLLFFVTALTYNLALDVLSISEAVKRTTTAVVNAQREWTGEDSTSEYVSKSVHDAKKNVKEVKGATPTGFMQFQEFAMDKAQQTILKELGDILNQTNATELAMAVRQGFAPILSSFPEKLSISIVVKKSRELYESLFTKSAGGLDWVNIGQKLMERWEPFFSVGAKILIRIGTNMMGLFDSIYALVLLVCVLRYFTHLERTVLYYLVEKVFKVIHPRLGERHARKIEEEITTSFFTLLLSFWHLTWFHFCITFCLFKTFSFVTPFLCGMVSTFTAVLPLSPKWLSPIAFALVYSLFEAISIHGLIGAVLSPRVWWCFVAFAASFADEWLLSVSRGIRGESLQDAAGVYREQLPTSVVGTALVLGYVSYGVRGILIGPLTIIVAKVLFDNWDTVFDRERNPSEEVEAQRET